MGVCVGGGGFKHLDKAMIVIFQLWILPKHKKTFSLCICKKQSPRSAALRLISIFAFCCLDTRISLVFMSALNMMIAGCFVVAFY